jgi:signal peptidase I
MDNKVVSFLKEYVPYVLVIILVILIKRFVVTPIRVVGDSMYDTLHDGDIMILNIIGYRFSDIKRFDIVVVDKGTEPLIKRVIGLPGEEIEYKDNQLYVNGKKVKENYGSDVTEDFAIAIPKGSYFVMGDNRTNSMDSRYYGPFQKKDILGKTKLTIFPFGRFGNKE